MVIQRVGFYPKVIMYQKDMPLREGTSLAILDQLIKRIFFSNKASKASTFQNDGTASAKGEGYAVYMYDNSETSMMLWYHDYMLGMMRLNVCSWIQILDH